MFAPVGFFFFFFPLKLAPSGFAVIISMGMQKKKKKKKKRKKKREGGVYPILSRGFIQLRCVDACLEGSKERKEAGRKGGREECDMAVFVRFHTRRMYVYIHIFMYIHIRITCWLNRLAGHILFSFSFSFLFFLSYRLVKYEREENYHIRDLFPRVFPFSSFLPCPRGSHIRAHSGGLCEIGPVAYFFFFFFRHVDGDGWLDVDYVSSGLKTSRPCSPLPLRWTSSILSTLSGHSLTTFDLGLIQQCFQLARPSFLFVLKKCKWAFPGLLWCLNFHVSLSWREW